MGVESRSVIPTNSLILIMDSRSGQIPESMGGRAVSSTSSCVAVGTKEESEGTTELRMADVGEEIELPALNIYDGRLEVSSGELVASNVLGEAFLRWPMDGPSVRVQIYTNHSTEPDQIVVVVG
ncbi:MAG: hypothetical protein GEU78_16675 [Actinobacteria bacterium]|nr:hypothetical protein [Actinomycetota bacterium]